MKSSYAGGGPSKIAIAPTCMCDASCSCARNEASTGERRSLCPVAIGAEPIVTIGPVRTLVVVLAVQFVIAAVFVTLVATGTLFGGADSQSDPRPAAVRKVDRFDADRAWGWLVRQVRVGPRPAGSPPSR